MTDKKNRYYWIKLKTNFFEQETIDFLMSQKNGCQYIVLYQMLCLNTANTDGLLCSRIGEMIVPFDINKIVRDTKYFDFDTVAVALEMFKKLGLIYEEEEGILKITNLGEMIGSESASKEAIKKRNYRMRKKIEQNDVGLLQKKSTNYQHIVDKYNEICVSFPKVLKISENRKKMISARLNMYSENEIIEAFEKAEKSSFLKGANDRNWKADFDWIMSDRNIIKIIEGKYDSELKGKSSSNTQNESKNKFNNFSQRNYSNEELADLEKKLLNR